MVCPKCNVQIKNDKSNYCPSCGQRVQSTKSKGKFAKFMGVSFLLLGIFGLLVSWGVVTIGLMVLLMLQPIIGILILMLGGICVASTGFSFFISGIIMGNLKESIKGFLTGLGLMLVAALAVDLMMSFALIENTNIWVQVFFSTGICIMVSISLLQKAKRWLLLPLSLWGTHFILVLCAQIDFPKFIRRIDGEDFLPFYFKFILISLAVAIAVELIVACIMAHRANRRSSTLKFSDSDLMLLLGFDRYSLSGYYLLKGKLHGILSETFIEPTEDSAGSVAIEIVDGLQSEEKTEYLKQNPQVKKVASHIEQQPEKSAYISDIVSNVRPDPQIQSEGGEYYTAAIRRIKTVFLVCVFSFMATSVILGILKLEMGLANGKPTGGLMGAIMIFAVFCGFLFWANNFLANIVVNFALKGLLKIKSKDFPDPEGMLVSMKPSGSYTGAEVTKLLRAYVLAYAEKKKPVVEYEPIFVNQIFASVYAARMAEIKAQSYSSGGCSSCSSCSSCGGGCGGCGGCGD